MKVFIDRQNRVAGVVDENPRYLRLLCFTQNNGVDVVNVTHDEFAARGFRELTEPHVALKLADTMATSFQPKSESAARYIEEIKMAETKVMSMEELVAEYNRVTGKQVKRFATKAAALKALEKAAATKNVGESPAKSNGAMADTAAALMEGADMATKKTGKTKKAKGKTKAAPKKRSAPSADAIERAKKVAKSTTGSGGFIRELLRKGGLDDEQILSRVLKKFPDGNTSKKDISWNRSMLHKAGVKGF